MNPTIKKFFIHLGLFVITLITTTLAGAEWQFGRFLGFEESPLTWQHFLEGFYFSLPFLGILTIHEFGHFFTARWHKVKVTLPYYLPFWFGFIGMPSIGTMGAFIRIKEYINSRTKYFDIGIAGPLAGFVVALGVLFYGFTHLPPAEYIFEIHPEYQEHGLAYADHVYEDNEGAFKVGTTLLFEFFKQFVASDPSRVPNDYEMIHYPWLFAGYLALFFTALNLIPIGQLDGGHVLYGLIGSRRHRKISAILFIFFITYAGIGVVSPYGKFEDLLYEVPLYAGFLYLVLSRLTASKKNNLLIAVAILFFQFFLVLIFPQLKGYQGWLVFALLLGRFLGLYHPQAYFDEPLDNKRKVLGWVALIIFILCFSPSPFVVEG